MYLFFDYKNMLEYPVVCYGDDIFNHPHLNPPLSGGRRIMTLLK